MSESISTCWSGVSESKVCTMTNMSSMPMPRSRNGRMLWSGPKKSPTPVRNVIFYFFFLFFFNSFWFFYLQLLYFNFQQNFSCSSFIYLFYQINFCRSLYLNQGPMESEATALPSEPQSLPVHNVFFKKWAIPGLFFLYFRPFNTVDSK